MFYWPPDKNLKGQYCSQIRSLNLKRDNGDLFTQTWKKRPYTG